MNEKIEQIKTVFSDEAFVKTCIEAENEEAVQKLLADKGVEMSLTEIELMKEMIGAMANGTITEEDLEKLTKAGELSEDELAEAAGGGLGDFFTKIVKTTEQEWDWGEMCYATVHYEQRVMRWGNVGKVGVAVAAIGAAVYAGVKYKDEIVSGAKTAYNWVSDNITRW